MHIKLKNKKGFGLIEIILSVAMVSVFITIFIGAILDSEESLVLAEKRKVAVRVAESSLEAVRNIRDTSYSNLLDGNYGLTILNGRYELLPASDLVDNIYTRTIHISTVDNMTKKVESNVTWIQNERRNGSITLVTYLVNQALP